MKISIKKIIQSLYCVNVPCAICGEPLTVKIWYSFRNAGTYFCNDCAEDICRQLKRV